MVYRHFLGPQSCAKSLQVQFCLDPEIPLSLRFLERHCACIPIGIVLGYTVVLGHQAAQLCDILARSNWCIRPRCCTARFAWSAAARAFFFVFVLDQMVVLGHQASLFVPSGSKFEYGLCALRFRVICCARAGCSAIRPTVVP